ncbi:MAG TPA: hypothetical protein VMZ00_02005 [Sporichthya sp.]|nr:hypothetical protein [Sporichthya sp.]
MNSILDPPSGRSAAVYWRRRAMIFAAFAVVLLLMVKACGGDGPDLSSTVVQKEVPLVSTYTPTPSATATPDPSADPSVSVDPSRFSDPGIGDDPSAPYAPGGTPADPCEVPGMQPAMTDEAGQPLCDEPALTARPTTDPTKAPSKPTSGHSTKPTLGPPARPTPTPTSDSQAAGPLSCAKSVLTVKLKADREVYSGSAKPKLYLGVKNSGPNECLIDMGSKALSFTIISGKDRIWSSDDCQGKGTKDVRLLKPGQTMWARAVWSKVRSTPGCPKGMPAAKPGYYVVDGSAGGVKAQRRAVFRVA